MKKQVGWRAASVVITLRWQLEKNEQHGVNKRAEVDRMGGDLGGLASWQLMGQEMELDP